MRDTGVQGQDPQLGRVLEPAQHQQRLRAGGRGALDRTGTWPAAVRCEPPRHDLQGGFGHVETGTIGDQRGVLAGEQGVLADSRSFRPGPRVLTATHREPAGHGPAGRPPAFNLSSKTHHRAEERGEKTSLLFTREEDRLIRRLVQPFYLKMYLMEALAEVDPRAARRLRRKLIRAGRKVTSQQVEWLLRQSGWRELTMGAWFALALPADEVRGAVVGAWNNAVGLDAVHPLATVSVLIAGSDAIAGMQSFVARRDGRDDLGTAGYVSAAIAHLGGSPPFDPDPMVVASFQDSVKVATDLQGDFRAAHRSPWHSPLWQRGRKSYTVGS